MTFKLNGNSALAFGLVAILLIGHRSLFRDITALRSDPCDAVFAFASVTIILIPIGSVVRAFRKKQKTTPSELRLLYVVRSQQAVVLSVLLTLTADIAAVCRHKLMGISPASRNAAIAWLSALVGIAFASQLLILAELRSLNHHGTIHWKRVILAAIFLAAILRSCPQWPSDYSSATAHFLTVMVGAVVVFSATRFLLCELVPYGPEDQRNALSTRVRDLYLLVAGGASFVVGLWLGTMGELDGARYTHTALMVLVTASALLVTYALLEEPLGFMGSRLSGN